MKLPAEIKKANGNMYVVINDLIKGSDLCYDLILDCDTGELVPCVYQKRLSKNNQDTSSERKIIASNDSCLDLPRIPTEFINQFDETTQVLVEYEVVHTDQVPGGFEKFLKISQDNTISIEPNTLNHS